MPNLQGKIELIKQAQVDIKDAIVYKGVTPTGNISTYADAISNIVTKNNQTKTVTENGIVRYDTGYTGLEQVTVNVNQSVQNKNITTNGTYTADSGYVGLGVVTVDVSPDVIAKTITANGTYNAEDDDVEGYSSVTVNVPSPIDNLINGSITSVDTAVTSIKGGAFKDCEDLDTVVLRSNTVVDLSDESIFENTPIDETWSVATQNTDLSENEWSDLIFDGNKFIALNNSSLFSSTNGVSWSIITTLGGFNRALSIAYGGGRYVIMPKASTHCQISLDNVSWSDVYFPSQTFSSIIWHGITYGNNKFIAVSRSGYLSTLEDNSTTWSELINIDVSPISIIFNNNKFISLESMGKVSISTNGTTWEQVANLGSYSWQSIIFNGYKYIALGKNGYMAFSENLINWTSPIQITNLGANSWCALACNNDKTIALGGTGYISMSNIATGNIYVPNNLLNSYKQLYNNYNFLPIS